MIPAEFASQVCSAYLHNLKIFKNKVNAEDLIPANCSNNEKALFLFYVIQLDYATKSQRLYEGANKLFRKKRTFFIPNYILNLSQKKLEEFLVKYLRPRYINEAKKRYKQNSQLLKSKYNGDPREIFEKSKTAQDALNKVGEFRGFGPKIGNFFVRTMINVFAYAYDDVEDILPPVDIHDVRIAYLMGYVKSDSMAQKNVTEVKKLWSNACKKAGVSWLVFDKALWLLGSEGQPKSKGDVLQMLKPKH